MVADRPKPMASFNEGTFLHFIIAKLEGFGFNRIILSTGFMSDFIEQRLTSLAQQAELLVAREDSPLGTGGAVKNAMPLIAGDTFCVMNGDSFCDFNFDEMLAFHQAKGGQCSLLLSAVEDASAFGTVELNESGYITSFKEKLEDSKPGLVNAGFYIFTRQLVRQFPASQAFSLEREFFPKLIGSQLCGYQVGSKLYDIGTPQSYALALKELG